MKKEADLLYDRDEGKLATEKPDFIRILR